ncbi:thioesterase II family protein [Streptomyces heilongjiangensis]|uniref:Thioesterase II family protein n=1 Tax=Streptomyces heilongjiangensis TaxID=945052 RepID=A0ABW1B1J7_9ACTN|nr:alpha/beta fold hydrolase [Streptomyces heilongjiangensis]MDC2945620.1 alpha/beta fold hydrolase [Streptomyces heilongjiangensis]
MSPLVPDVSTLVPRPQPGAPVRLLCFPNAGAGTAGYRHLAELLAPCAELRVVRLPGRERRWNERPHASLEPLLLDLAEDLAPHLDPAPGQRLAFFGHSMGALVAFELARLLRARGARMPDSLLVSGLDAPHRPRTGRVVMHGLDDDAFAARLPHYGGTPRELLDQPELLKLFLPTLRADFAVVETYRHRPEPPLEMPVAAYGGRADRETSVAGLAAWAELTTGTFRHRMFDGGHFYLTERPAELAAEVAGDLARFGEALV